MLNRLWKQLSENGSNNLIFSIWNVICLEHRIRIRVLCVQLTHSGLGDEDEIFITHLMIIIKSEVSAFNIVVIFSWAVCLRWLCHYIPWTDSITSRESRVLCLHFYCAFYDVCKWLGTLWLGGRIRLFVHLTISVLLLCRLISLSPEHVCQVYFAKSVSEINSIFSTIVDALCEAACFHLTYICFDDCENISASSYYRRIRNIKHYLLFRVKSCSGGVSCKSCYILTNIQFITAFTCIQVH